MIDQNGFEGTNAGGLRQYLETIRRRKWIVLGVFAFAVAAAAAVSFLQQPVYRAEMEILIGQGGGLIDAEAASAIQPYTATMRDLLHSTAIAEQVIDRLDLTDEPQDLLDHLTVEIDPETAVLDCSFLDAEPERAREILQEFGLVFQQFVKERFADAGVTPAPGGTTQQIAKPTAIVTDPAHVEDTPVSPKPIQNIVIAGVLGLILGLLIAFLREHFDRGLRTREAVERAFGGAVPVIGQIPFERRRRDDRGVTWAPFGEIAEAYRGLRANLQYLSVRRPLRTILVTSASPEQGKTTVTANLAVAIARSGATTVALEADLRRPRLDAAFGIAGDGPGLTSVLVGTADLEDSLREVSPATGEDGTGARGASGRLAFMPSGPLPPNPSELLSSAQMTKLLDRLSVTYDYVLIDSPPVLPVADALELARIVDGVVLVIRRDHSTTDEVREVRALVERLGVQLVGVIFTDVESFGTYGTYGEPEREAEAMAQQQRADATPRPVEREPEREPVVTEEV